MKIIQQSHKIETEIDRDKILKSIEVYGRTAYKSEDKITKDSVSKFVQMIVKNGHESVVEHINITVRFITDRGVTHELVRHRLVSYTQESTRYCNYANKKDIEFIKPVFWGEPCKEYDLVNQPEVWRQSMLLSEINYDRLIKLGATPQEARSVLPNSLKTEIVCTTNLREWRHILKVRTSKKAHPQMRALMIPLLNVLKEKLPEIFGDIESD